MDVLKTLKQVAANGNSQQKQRSLIAQLLLEQPKDSPIALVLQEISDAPSVREAQALAKRLMDAIEGKPDSTQTAQDSDVERRDAIGEIMQVMKQGHPNASYNSDGGWLPVPLSVENKKIMDKVRRGYNKGRPEGCRPVGTPAGSNYRY